MIKLICKKCGEVWYTANTRPNQKCSGCGGNLVEEDFIFPKDIETKKEGLVNKDDQDAAIHSMCK